MINHRNDVRMYKTQMEPHATGKWLKIVFYLITITLTVLRSFPEAFLGKSGPREREKQIFPSSHRLPVLSLTIALHQSEREKMLRYCKNTNWKLLIQWSKQSFLGRRTQGTFWSEALASSETCLFTGNCIFINSWWGDWKGARDFFISLFLFRSMYCFLPNVCRP